MAFIDVIVLIITLIIVFLIVFFSFVFPRIKGDKKGCSSCPSVKRAKRLVKDYKK